MNPLDRLQAWLESHRKTGIHIDGYEAEGNGSLFRASVIRDDSDAIVGVGNTVGEAVERLVEQLET